MTSLVFVSTTFTIGICVPGSRENVTSLPSPATPDSLSVRTAPETALFNARVAGVRDVLAAADNARGVTSATGATLSITTTLFVLSADRGNTLTRFSVRFIGADA